MSKTKEELAAATIPELEAHLDEERGTSGKDYLVSVMAVRNAKIRQAELDHWGLTEEQYCAAKEVSGLHDRCEQRIGAAQIALRKLDPEKDAEKIAELTAALAADQKTFETTKRTPLHKALQDAQRRALLQVRDAQTAVAGAAVVKTKVVGT